MRLVRALSIALPSLVAILPLVASSPAIAQSRGANPGLTVRMEAIDGLLNQIVPRKPYDTAGVRARIQTMDRRQSPSQQMPAQLTYFGASTNWTVPDETPANIPGATGTLQCVPYARFMSGIGIHGDAWTWWEQAAGIFARGNYPEPGAVLSFPGSERMPLGHVAVVHRILGARKILIDHANWPTATVLHGAISRDMLAVDVSAANDWSDVRIQFGEGGGLGSVYAANGFIYGWSETGARLARPHYAGDDAHDAALGPSWRMFNAISYVWALPPAAREKAYVAAGVRPRQAATNGTAMAAGARGRPALVLGPLGPGLMGSTLMGGRMIRTMGFSRLELGSNGRARPGFNRFVMQ